MTASRAAVCVLALVLAACAAPAPPEGEIKTASDLTDVDRLVNLRMELASGYFARGQTSTALDEVKQVLALRPTLPEAYNLRGLIYADLGQMNEAEASFRRALQLRPGDADTLHNFGWFLCLQRRFDDGDSQFAAALQQPQYRNAPRTLLARGICQARAGRWEDARTTLSHSYELDPANPVTGFNLADVLYHLADYDRARFYVRRVNASPETTNAQTLWLAARIEHRLGNDIAARGLAHDLEERFPDSAESLRYERSQFAP